MTETRQESPETTESPPPSITEAWGRLCDWASAQRLDWDGPMIRAAMRLAHAQEIPYRVVWETLARLAWDLSADTRAVIGELTNLNRAPVRRGAGDSSARDALAALRRGDLEAARAELGTQSVVPPQPRVSGAQPVLREAATEGTERNREEP